MKVNSLPKLAMFSIKLTNIKIIEFIIYRNSQNGSYSNWGCSDVGDKRLLVTSLYVGVITNIKFQTYSPTYFLPTSKGSR